MVNSKLLAVVLPLVVVVSAQSGLYGQCGGIGYSGSTTCSSGVCTVINPYYSQCLPGTATPTTTIPTTTHPPTTTTPPSTTTPRSPTTSPSTPPTTTSPPPSGSTSGCPFSSLQSGYLWLRSVESPTFHEYVQSKTLCSASDAVLGPYTSAANIQVTGGQLVQLVNSQGGLIYANVKQSSATDKLQVVWSNSQNTYGTFAFQGDGLTWTVPSISRPNTGAWLVCNGTASDGSAEQQMWVNLGNYGYMTPAGCTDTTLNYYNAATATNKLRL